MQISELNSLVPSLKGTGSVNGTSAGEGGFADILSEAIGDAQQTDAAVQQENENLLTGESGSDSLHTAMIEAQKAELALNLAVQIRNKVLESYNEVMRMQL